MRALIVAACIAMASVPAAAQDSPYDRAVAARLAGDPQQAVQLLEPWLADHPGDTDARVQYGFALLALGRYDDAETAFHAVLAAAPEYADARDGLALVEQRRAGDTNGDGDAAMRRGFLLVETALSDVGNGQDDWHEIGLTASVPINPETTVDASARWYDRFGSQDTELGALVTYRADADSWLRLGGSFAPSAQFRPEVAVAAGVDRRIASDTIGSIDASWQRFPLQDVITLRPGITQYFAGGRFALTVHGRAVFADGEDILIGGTVRGDYLPGDRQRLFVGVATGPETDLGIVSDTTSLFAGGEFPISRDLSMIGSVTREWRGIGADRTEGRIGIKIAL